MTPHVAEATEARGRVILRFSAWTPNDCAIEAAMLVAHAFNSEVELLFVEDRQRVDFAGFPFAREFPIRGGRPRPVSPRSVRAEMQGAFAAARKRVAAAAAEMEVNVYEHVVSDDPVHALVSACARRGPWNMIAIAETFGSPQPFSLDEVFENVLDATGIIIVGPEARRAVRRTPGPVVLAVEESEQLQSMLRAGQRLASDLEVEVVVLIVAATDDELARMEGEVRLVLAEQEGVRLAPTGATYEHQATVAEAIRRLGAGFLIAKFGGVTAPRGASLRPLTCTLPCPVLLVR